MDKVKWIIHACGKLSIGGVQSFLMNYYKSIDRTKYQFAFAVQRDYEMPYDKEILDMGGRIHYLPRIDSNVSGYVKELTQILKSHKEYCVIHCHMNQKNAIPLYVAKKCGIPIRISHAHNTKHCSSLMQSIRYTYFSHMIKLYATEYSACSLVANNDLHGSKKAVIVKNAIDSGKFLFNAEVRKQIRKEYNIDNQIVLGHIGNFSAQKNTGYLIDILSKLPDKYSLMLVGDGEEKKGLINKCQTYGCSERVIFTGIKKSHEILQAMDIFLFPSKYEGLGMVAIEASAAGVPVITSTEVPSDVDIVEETVHLPIGTESIQLWANKIIEYTSLERKNNQMMIISSGYDIASNISKLERLYNE